MDLTWPRGSVWHMRCLPGRQQGMTRCLLRMAEVVTSRGKRGQWMIKKAMEAREGRWPQACGPRGEVSSGRASNMGLKQLL